MNTSVRMRKARLSAGFKRVKVFAKAIGSSEPTIYRIESGQDPSIKTLKRWARQCGVSSDYLLCLDQPEAAE